jgi:glycosyltransferase involved in cell wall biosynthesis
MYGGVETDAVSKKKKLRCLYISRYAPIRTKTDPYTGLPSYLSQQTWLTGIWNRPERGAVAFRASCEEVIEVIAGVKGWLYKLRHSWANVRGPAKPDFIVCGVDEHSLSLAILAGKTAGIPVYAFAEDPPFTNRYNGFLSTGRRVERGLRRKIIHALLEHCSGVFCFVEKDALRAFNILRVPVHQMMNGPSTEARTWFEESSRNVPNSGELVVGLVGALSPDQGLDKLLEIIAGARKRIKSLSLRLIGPMDREYQEVFQEKTIKLALDSATEVTGWLAYPMMLEKLQDCSFGLYCNPDTNWFRVAQPLKICEYLALEKPVIAWDYPGARRLLDNGRLGLLVPPNNLPAFIDAVVQMSDLKFRETMVREIRKALKERWSSQYWYQQVLRIVTNAAQGAKNESRK